MRFPARHNFETYELLIETYELLIVQTTKISKIRDGTIYFFSSSY